MNKAQRATYFGDLWPAACRTQGWLSKDGEQRRLVTLKATGKESTSALSEDEITQLFDCLKDLAAGREIQAEMTATQSHEETKARNVCKQFIFLIEQHGFADEYVEEVAKWRCREAQVATWKRLPTEQLVKVLYTIEERARTQAEKAGTVGVNVVVDTDAGEFQFVGKRPVVRRGPRKPKDKTPGKAKVPTPRAEFGDSPEAASPLQPHHKLKRIEQPF